MTRLELIHALRNLDHVERNHIREQQLRSELRVLPLNVVHILLTEYVPEYLIAEWLEKMQKRK